LVAPPGSSLSFSNFSPSHFISQLKNSSEPINGLPCQNSLLALPKNNYSKQMTEKGDEVSKPFEIADTLLIFLLGIIAYANAYCYQLGYLAFFNIPSEFITLSPEKFASSIIATAIFTILTLFVINLARTLILNFQPKKESIFAPIYTLNIILVCIIAPLIVYMGLSWSSIFTAIKFLFAINFLIIIGASITIAAYLLLFVGAKKLSPNIRIEEIIPDEDTIGLVFMRNRISRKYLIAIATVSAVAAISFMAGNKRASDNRTFSEITNKHYLIIEIFGNQIITKPYDEKTHSLSNETVLFTMDQLSMLPIKSRKFSKAFTSVSQ
jgi:hypothetical protein